MFILLFYSDIVFMGNSVRLLSHTAEAVNINHSAHSLTLYSSSADTSHQPIYELTADILYQHQRLCWLISNKNLQDINVVDVMKCMRSFRNSFSITQLANHRALTVYFSPVKCAVGSQFCKQTEQM